MAKAPAFQFYPGDWIQDTRMLDPLTRGLWIDMLCFMWRAEYRGLISGTKDQLSRLLSCTPDELTHAVNELSVTKTANVTTCNDLITIKNRRMFAEERTRILTRSRVEKFRNATKTRTCNDDVTRPSSSSSSDLLDSSNTLPCTITDNSIERASANADTRPEKKVSRKQMPKDFSLTPEREAYAKAKGLNGSISAVWEAFTLHHQSKGTTMQDWNKAWMKWVLNEVKFHPPEQARSKRTGLEDWMDLPDGENQA